MFLIVQKHPIFFLLLYSFDFYTLKLPKECILLEMSVY